MWKEKEKKEEERLKSERLRDGLENAGRKRVKIVRKRESK